MLFWELETVFLYSLYNSELQNTFRRLFRFRVLIGTLWTGAYVDSSDAVSWFLFMQDVVEK